MATDGSSVPGSSRPRPWLLALLGTVLVVFIATQMFSGEPSPPAVPTSGTQRTPNAQQTGAVNPSDLDVKIESLTPEQAPAQQGDRNPFRFGVKVAPAPPQEAAPQRSAKPAPLPAPVTLPPTEPAGPPPIGNAIKFIGIVDTGAVKIGAFSDCKATFPGREGEIIEGRFRVVRIGVESAVLEYADGQGRTTLPLNGQACVGK